MSLTTQHPAPTATDPARRHGRGPIGRVTLASLLAGVAGALVAALVVFPGGSESRIIGSTLIAFAAGWAMLALLSIRLTDVPQRWAMVPAAVMSVGGVTAFTMPRATQLSPLLAGSGPSSSARSPCGWASASSGRSRAGRPGCSTRSSH